MFNLFKFINTQDPEEGGAPFVEVDLEDRTIRSGTKLNIKTIAAAYTVTGEDSGSVIVARTAASCTVTLPSAAASKGMHVVVVNAADQTLIIASVANEMITFNDLDADAITFSTSSELIGSAVWMICDGTSWLGLLLTQETVTPTITT